MPFFYYGKQAKSFLCSESTMNKIPFLYKLLYLLDFSFYFLFAATILANTAKGLPTPALEVYWRTLATKTHNKNQETQQINQESNGRR